MRRLFRSRRAGLTAIVTALAVTGGVVAVVLTPGANRTSALSAAARPRHLLALPSPAPSVKPAPSSSAPAAEPQPKVTEKPPPVVNGIRRTNVGSAHSPRTLSLLSNAAATMPPPADAGARGIDVADYQHPHGAAINWSRVAAAGYRFAFIKATEGDYYRNPYHAADLSQAKAAGLYATGYHFAVPNVSSGASQADYAVRNGRYAADGRTLPLALDIEYNPYGGECYGLSATGMVSWLSAFNAEVRRLTGQLPVIYTTADWWRSCTGSSRAFASDPLWIAGYVSGNPPMPAGWTSWTFWQFTSRGAVPGITGNVDVSYFLSGAVRLLDPGNQHDAAGTAIRLQVRSLSAGQPPHFTAAGLPPGLSIDVSGLISGTISSTASGTFGVTIKAANPAGGAGSASFTWTVTSRPPSPLPSPSPSPLPSPSPPPSSAPPSAPHPSSAPPSSPPPSSSPSPSAPESASPSVPPPSEPGSPSP